MASLPRFLLLLLPLFLAAISEVAAATVGFSTELILRDSLRSPHYNPLDSSASRVAGIVKRSNDRLAYFTTNSGKKVGPQAVESTVFAAGAEYLMTIAVGTPAVDRVAIADTGSDLIWFQCEPCDECYKQSHPLFDPERSSTYRNVSCESEVCGSLRSSCSDGGTCEYQYSYGDGSVTSGTVATETIALSGAKLPKTPFGCGHFNNGTFSSADDGLVGLGGGSLSLIRRLGPTISGKFAYCLVPRDAGRNVSSVLSFGLDAVVSGGDAVTTPRVPADPETFYYLTLQKITVSPGIAGGSPSDDVVVRLPDVAAEDVRKLPRLRFGFEGAEVGVGTNSAFLEVDAKGTYCLAVAPASGGVMIFGNTMQQNLKVGYDLEEGTVSFASADCISASSFLRTGSGTGRCNGNWQ
ncbi:hypothetical protein H6P81_020434 [Aristolochia fimbriata]|uniref:Peptidase A1 domain-containing protein n=1 Tax=Aristolochia fimbriata TaxID=158543 RepID=A0AAV7DUP2_ARIFI|nr:hypothetical protein H6P81_020434 [Aristolochia fimbriata]